jgi:hypothetical protein
MTDLSPAVHPAPEPLAGLLVGDTAIAAPRAHGLPGRFFIGFTCLMSFVSALRALVLVIAIGNGPGVPVWMWKQGLAACVWAVLQWRLAGEVRRFSRWGWYGAMAELTLAALTQLFWVFLLRELAFLFVALLIADMFFLRYFWKRRVDFGIDRGG